MTVQPRHFADSDRDLLIIAGQRLMAWAHDFTFHECDGQTWYRSQEDDPLETAYLLYERLDEAERATAQARRLLYEGLSAAYARAIVETQ